MILDLPSRSRRFVGDRGTLARTVGSVAYFLGLALLVFLPLLGRGYLLTLDMVFAPDLSFVRYLFRASDPLYYGRLPVVALLDAASILVPTWMLQRGVLVGIVVGSGLSMYRACRARSVLGALFAGTLYAINPFVYVRLLAGHWWLLLGYAALPMAVASFADALAGRGRPRRAAAWATVASAFDPHVAVLLAVAYACLGGVALVQSPRRTVIEQSAKVAVIAMAFNAYWLLPAVSTLAGGRSKVATMTGLDLLAFSARGDLGGNVPLSVATLLGFWRGGYRLPVGTVPEWAWIGLFAVVLLAALVGWYEHREEPLANGLLVVGVVGFVLALGVSVDATAPLFRTLYEHAVVFRGMRDSQKFAALLVLAYAFLGASGVDRLVGTVDRWLPVDGDRIAVGYARIDPALPTRRTVALVVVALLVLSTPLVYTWPMLWGFSGQLSATDYPDGWAEANDHLVDEPGTYRVLFLPWHQYITFPWTDGRVANPADAYFDRPTIRSRSIGIAGIDSQAASPTHDRVSVLVEDLPTADRMGPELARLGVKYVIVARAVDYRRYDDALHGPPFEAVVANDDLVVYENRAFEDAPPREAWPRAWPVVPWGMLALGAVVSVAAAFLAFVRSPSRRLGTVLDSFRVAR